MVIDRAWTFYPPAAAAWGVDLGRLIVVRPQNSRDELWAAVQRSVRRLWRPCRPALIGSTAGVSPAAVGSRSGPHAGGVGAAARGTRGQPTWADVTFEASPLSVVRGPLYGATDRGPRTRAVLFKFALCIATMAARAAWQCWKLTT